MERTNDSKAVKDILIDVRNFLDDLENLSGICRADRDRLVRHIGDILSAMEKARISNQSVEEYLDMQHGAGAAPPHINGINDHLIDEEEEPQPIYEGYGEEPEEPNHSSALTPTVSLETNAYTPSSSTYAAEAPEAPESCPHSGLSYMRAMERTQKYGPLECKERSMWRFKDVLRTWHAVLIDHWLLFYSNESEEKPQMCMNLIGYQVAQCHNPPYKDPKKKDCCFEMTHATEKPYQFYARTNKDLAQWMVAIEGAASRPPRTPRRLPTPPPPLAHDTDGDDDVFSDENEGEESIYEEVKSDESNGRNGARSLRDTEQRVLNYDVPRATPSSPATRRPSMPLPPLPARAPSPPPVSRQTPPVTHANSNASDSSDSSSVRSFRVPSTTNHNNNNNNTPAVPAKPPPLLPKPSFKNRPDIQNKPKIIKKPVMDDNKNVAPPPWLAGTEGARSRHSPYRKENGKIQELVQNIERKK